MVDARLLVLVSLSDGPKHGYAIQTDVDGFAAVRLGPGTLYGALSTLERDGLVEALPSEEPATPLPTHRSWSSAARSSAG